MADTDLIGTKEAAALLGIERSTISTWVLKGWLTPAVKLGGKTGAFLFRRTEVESQRFRVAKPETAAS